MKSKIKNRIKVYVARVWLMLAYFNRQTFLTTCVFVNSKKNHHLFFFLHYKYIPIKMFFIRMKICFFIKKYYDTIEMLFSGMSKYSFMNTQMIFHAKYIFILTNTCVIHTSQILQLCHCIFYFNFQLNLHCIFVKYVVEIDSHYNLYHRLYALD